MCVHKPIASEGEDVNAQRPVPLDFEIIFVEQGRLECETWYRVGRKTVNRWLNEVGKEGLIERRAAFVRSQRSQGRWLTRASSMIDRRAPRKSIATQIKDDRSVSPAMANRAARYLRSVRAGGWVVARKPDGNWIVGTRPRSAAELVDLAERKGFDRKLAALQIAAEEGEDAQCQAL